MGGAGWSAGYASGHCFHKDVCRLKRPNYSPPVIETGSQDVPGSGWPEMCR